MGFFTKRVPVQIRGVIERIGIIRINETVIVYAFTLEGRSERFKASLHQEDRREVNRIQLGLAEKGDKVLITVSDKYPTEVDAFQNLDLA